MKSLLQGIDKGAILPCVCVRYVPVAEGPRKGTRVAVPDTFCLKCKGSGLITSKGAVRQ